jgi:hypothetical protein
VSPLAREPVLVTVGDETVMLFRYSSLVWRSNKESRPIVLRTRAAFPKIVTYKTKEGYTVTRRSPGTKEILSSAIVVHGMLGVATSDGMPMGRYALDLYSLATGRYAGSVRLPDGVTTITGVRDAMVGTGEELGEVVRLAVDQGVLRALSGAVARTP